MMPRRHAGFTLIEILIALVLMTLILLGLVSALYGYGQSMGTQDRAIERIEDQRTLHNFLHTVLTTTLAATVQSPEQSGLYFKGPSQEMEWIAPMPARPNMAGIHYMHLFTRQNGPSQELVFQLMPYISGEKLPAWANEPVLSMVSIDKIELQYQAQDDTPWLPNWNEPNSLPARIKLDITSQGRAWPPIVAALTSVDPVSGLISGVVR